MKYRRISLYVFLVFLATTFILLSRSNIGLKQNKTASSLEEKISVTISDPVKVLKVVDGDTIKVLINNKEDTVRLIGIDSPEVLDERKPAQCFGRQASDKAKEVLVGKAVVLEQDLTQGDRDEYNRLLRYVFLEDGTNFNKFMVDGGYAREYTFKGQIYKYQSEFIHAEEGARKENKGMWGSC